MEHNEFKNPTGSDSESGSESQPAQWVDGIYDSEEEKVSVPYIETTEALRSLDEKKRAVYDQWIAEDPERVIKEIIKFEETTGQKLSNQEKIRFVLEKYGKPPATFKVIPPEVTFDINSIHSEKLSDDPFSADFTKKILGYLADFVNSPYFSDEFGADHNARAAWRVSMSPIFGLDFFKLYERNKFKWNVIGHTVEQLETLTAMLEHEDQVELTKQVIIAVEHELAPSQLKHLDFSRLGDLSYMTNEKYQQYRGIQEKNYKKLSETEKIDITKKVTAILLDYLQKLSA